jgi:hypothetical protein
LSSHPSLSIIVPARNAADTLAEALCAILATRLRRNDYELIVVDDASDDATATIAARHADKVVRLSGRAMGAAYARNRGVDLSQGEIVAFVDADVAVRPDTLPRMMATLAERPKVDAVCTLHDAKPGAGNFISQYWNLLLRFGEQRHLGENAQFPSGCGAVRRSVLLAAGMFDEWRFPVSSLEGVELGQRLQGSGRRLAVVRDIEFTRLRRWSLRGVCAEVWQRSTVLSRSLGYQRTRASTPAEVVFTLSRSLIPGLGIVCSLTLVAAFLPEPRVGIKGAAALAVLLLTNLPVYRFYLRARGIGFAIAAIPVHLVVQAVSGVALCTGWVLRDAVGDRLRDATTQAYSEVGLETWPPVPRRSLPL